MVEPSSVVLYRFDDGLVIERLVGNLLLISKGWPARYALTSNQIGFRLVDETGTVRAWILTGPVGRPEEIRLEIIGIWGPGFERTPTRSLSAMDVGYITTFFFEYLQFDFEKIPRWITDSLRFSHFSPVLPSEWVRGRHRDGSPTIDISIFRMLDSVPPPLWDDERFLEYMKSAPKPS